MKSATIVSNAGWPVRFRLAVHAGWSRVPEFTGHYIDLKRESPLAFLPVNP